MTKHCTLHYCYCGRGLSVDPLSGPAWPEPRPGGGAGVQPRPRQQLQLLLRHQVHPEPGGEVFRSSPPLLYFLTIQPCICRDLLQAVPDRVCEGGELGGGGALLPARHQAVPGQPPARGRGPGGRGNLLQSEYTVDISDFITIVVLLRCWFFWFPVFR